MPDAYRFRIATEEDLPRLVEMKLLMFTEAGRASLLPPSKHKAVLDDYARLYQADLARHFIACEDRGPVACVGAFIKDDLPYRYFEPPTYGFIGDVYTEPSHRSHGLAKRLSQDAMLWLRSRGVRAVRLLASEAGRPLYQKLGFRPSEEMVFTYAN